MSSFWSAWTTCWTNICIDGDLDLYHTTHVISPHYNDVIMGAMASQITSLTIDYSTVYSDADHISKHQSFASLAFVQGIHRGPVNSLHKWPVTRRMFPFDDAIMLKWTILQMCTLLHEVLDCHCLGLGKYMIISLALHSLQAISDFIEKL